MLNENVFQRFASPNERRTIAREDMGLYNAVVVGAVYEFPAGTAIDSASTFFGPLKQCIEEVPFFCVTVKDAHTEKPYYARVPTINLHNHISIVAKPFPEDKSSAMQNEIGKVMDEPFAPGIPPWKISVLPLRPSCCLITFGYSHALGDGMTGVIFHRKLLNAFHGPASADRSKDGVLFVPDVRLAGPMDTPERMPISWSYLLAPLIKYLLPNPLVNLLGLKDPVTTVNENCWIGSPIPKSRKGTHTKVRLCEVDADVMKRVLSVARKHDARLTSIIQQLIVRALSKTIQDPRVTNFVVQTPVNMRKSFGMSENEAGNNGSARYHKYTRAEPSACFSEEEWNEARSVTRALAEAAARLEDQPIALLRYVKDIHGWIRGKLGEERDASFEVSNVGCFDPGHQQSLGDRAKIVNMVFAHPGLPFGPPLSFDFVSVKGSTLVYTATWQAGGLGVPQIEEGEFVDRICAAFTQGFVDLAANE